MVWYDIKVRSPLLKNEIFSASRCSKFEKMKNGNKIYSSRALSDIYIFPRIYHVFYLQNKQKLYITYFAGWWQIIFWVNINFIYLSGFLHSFLTIKMSFRFFLEISLNLNFIKFIKKNHAVIQTRERVVYQKWIKNHTANVSEVMGEKL